MPDQKTIQRANADKKAGKSAGTQAGEFVHDEIEKIRQGEHGARSAKQAIAIGLSEARRAGVKLKTPAKGKVSKKTRDSAQRELKSAKKGKAISVKRSKASIKALKKEPKNSVSSDALSRQARSAAKKRSPAARSASAKKASRTRKAEN